MRRATWAVALSTLCVASMPATAAPLVSSDSDCPSAADVVTRLTGLWSADNPALVAARIHVGVGQMTVTLVSESEPASTRILPAEPDCQSRAQAAALVIAAWLDSVPAALLVLPEPVLPSGSFGADSPPRQPPRASPALVAVPAAAPVPVSAPAAQLQTSVTEAAPPAQSRFSLGLGGFASLDPRGASAALSGEAAWARVAGRFGLAATVAAPLPRSTSLGGGTAFWWRPVVGLALRAPLTQGAWLLDTGVGPVFGLLVVSGSGFRPNHTEAAASWGAAAGFRLAHRRSRAGAYWAELRTLLWPAAQSIRVIGSGASSAALPRIEGQLGLGFSFAVF
jgi:hypothetical protein